MFGQGMIISGIYTNNSVSELNAKMIKNRDRYRDQIVSISVGIVAIEYVMWVYFLYSTTYT